MKATPKKSAMQEAYDRLSIASETVRKACGCDYRIMEQVIQKSPRGEVEWAIIVERWLLGRGQQRPVDVILYVTNSWWNVYRVITDQNSLQATEDGLRDLLK